MPCAGELRADLIGAREIARFLGGGAFGDQRVDFGIGQPSGAAPTGCSTSKTESKRSRNRSAPRRRCRPGTRPHPWRVLVSRTYSNAAASASAVFRSSSSASSNALIAACGPVRERRVHALGELRGFQAQLVVAQPIDGSRRGLQSVESEVQLLAIRHRRQQVPHRFRRIALARSDRAAYKNCPAISTSSAPSTLRCSACSQ